MFFCTFLEHFWSSSKYFYLQTIKYITCIKRSTQNILESLDSLKTVKIFKMNKRSETFAQLYLFYKKVHLQIFILRTDQFFS